jgi:hypothetical protein
MGKTLVSLSDVISLQGSIFSCKPSFGKERRIIMPIIIGIIVIAVVVAVALAVTGTVVTVSAGVAALVIAAVLVVVGAVIAAAIMGGTSSDSPTGSVGVITEDNLALTVEMTCDQAKEVVAVINQQLNDAREDRDRKQTAYDNAVRNVNNAQIAVGVAVAAVAALWWNPIALAIAILALAAASAYLTYCNRNRDNAALDLTEANAAVAFLEEQLSVAQALQDAICNSTKDTPIDFVPRGFIVLPPSGTELPPIGRETCHVRIADGKVTCEGTCNKKGSCVLYARKKGKRSKWQRQEQGVKQKLEFEYRCFCHRTK